LLANITQHDLWWVVLILGIVVLALIILKRGRIF
jgi:hypothetical protein